MAGRRLMQQRLQQGSRRESLEKRLLKSPTCCKLSQRINVHRKLEPQELGMQVPLYTWGCMHSRNNQQP